MPHTRTPAEIQGEMHDWAAQLDRLKAAGAPPTARQRWHYVNRRLNLSEAKRDCALTLAAAYAAEGDLASCRAVSELVELYELQVEQAARIVRLYMPDSVVAVQDAARNRKELS